MANNLSTAISLTDNFTPQLRNISNAISTLSANLNSLELSKSLDPKAAKNLQQATQALDKSIGDLENESKRAAQEQEKHNQTLREGKSSTDTLAGGFKNLVGAIGGVVATYASIQGIKSVINWSDEITQTTSRLNLVNDSFNKINGSQQTTRELQDKIFQAAQASRGSYQDLEGLVASLGNNARDAFSSTDEMVTFAENLNKTFAISGASAEEMSNATLQLTQGLASGTLRGDELNSVLENAPELINVIANSMGVPRGQIRDLAAEGKITAEVVKNALIGSSDEINAKFQSMDVTFGQLWTQFTNTAQHAFEPVSKALGELANSPDFQASLDTLSSTIADLAPKVADFVSSVVQAAPTFLTALVDGFSWIVENGDRIGFLLSTIGGAFLAYQTYSFVAGVITTITEAWTAAKAAEEGLTIAQAALNLVMNANPIMLIVTAVGALVAGIIYLWNTNEGFRNAVIEAWNAIVGGFQQAWANISGIFTALAQGWDEAIITVQNFWTNLTNTVSGWWNSAYEWGSNLISGFLAGLGAFWNNIVTWFNDNFGWIINTVKSIFGIASPSTVFSEIGSNLIQGFWDGLRAVWDGVTQWATDAWNWLTGIFSGGSQEQDTQIVDYTAQIEATRAQLAQLQAEVQAGYNNILQVVVNSNAAIVAQGITMFTTMSSIVIQDSANMVAGINFNISQLPLLIGASLAGVIPVAQAYFIQLQALMVVQIQQLVGLSNTALLALIPTFQTILNTLRDQSIIILTELQNAAVQVILTMAGLVIAGVQVMNASILGLVAELSMNYLAAWSTLASETIMILNALASNARTATQQLVTGVTSVINTMPGIFRNSANNAMASFIDGINSQRAGAIGATNALVQAVKQAFITGLGIHSPSDETYWYGQMTGEGFIKGLSDSQLVEFAKGILTDMVTAFSEGRFKPEELVAYLDDDTLKVIDAYNRNPEILEQAGGGAQDQLITYPLIGTLGTQTSWFGPRESPGGIGSTNHGGVDLAAPTGTPIAAALAGNVTTAGWYGGYGQAVVIDSGNGIDITYGHMSQVLTQVGATVPKGAQIGLVGSTGNSTGPHLHFEMHQNGNRIDPQPYIEGASISAGASIVSAIQNAYNMAKGLGVYSSLGNIAYNPSAGVSQWTSVVLQALAMLGQPASLLTGVLYAIENESGGNPNAINDWDSNAAAGDPSRGLLQTIGSTFNAYRNKSLSNNIYDPLANVYAALNYMIQRYGSVANVVNPRLGGWYGYATGTSSATPGVRWVGENGAELVAFNGGERVFTNQESRALIDGRSSTATNRANSGSVINNTPVTVTVEIGTINNNDDLNFTIDKFSNMLGEVIDDILYNDPQGISVG